MAGSASRRSRGRWPQIGCRTHRALVISRQGGLGRPSRLDAASNHAVEAAAAHAARLKAHCVQICRTRTKWGRLFRFCKSSFACTSGGTVRPHPARPLRSYESQPTREGIVRVTTSRAARGRTRHSVYTVCYPWLSQCESGCVACVYQILNFPRVHYVTTF